MPSLCASDRGKDLIKQARNARGWTIDDSRWLTEASQILDPNQDWSDSEYAEHQIFASGISLSTWKRFLRGQPVQTEVFKAFCQVLGIPWKAIADLNLPQPSNTDADPTIVPAPKPGPVFDRSASSRIALEFPDGPVPLESPFYVERPPIESLACQEITSSGSVVRIQAPHKMGKSSLILRILARATQANYQIVNLDFRQADEAVLTNLDRLLRWLCVNASRQLRLKPQLDEFWDEETGSKICCTLYFQGYLLEQIKSPIVLVLNEINRLFEYPPIAQEFLPLLRSWHEEAKHGNSFQNLRLLVVHSTEVYVPLHIEQSPFNVGLPLKLPRFTSAQVEDLAQRHGLPWRETQVQKLVTMTGGHPYLVRLALYHLCTQSIDLDHLLHNAPTLSGIYNNHLQNYLLILQKEPELAKALYQVMLKTEGVRLAPTVAYKFDSMGLVLLRGNEVQPSCDLYRLYFREQLQ